MLILIAPLPKSLNFVKIIGNFWMHIAFAFTLLHSSTILGNKKTAVFFAISLSFGLFSELFGVAYGWIFGSYYYNFTPFFFGLVPLMTPISWAIIIYMCYTMTNIFLFCVGGKKPDIRKDEFWYFFVLMILLSSVDGLIAVNLDMILDPVAVSQSIPGWIWIGGGPYFRIPISNFVGWFLVTFAATFIFRFFESFSSKKEYYLYTTLYLYIVIMYFLYFLKHASEAINMHHIEYVLIGGTTMLPFVLISFLLIFIKIYKKK